MPFHFTYKCTLVCNNVFEIVVFLESMKSMCSDTPEESYFAFVIINLNSCKYIIMIQRLFVPFMMNCQRDLKMCPWILVYVLIQMKTITMNCLNRLWWTPSPNILPPKQLDLKSTNIGFLRVLLVVFCVLSNIEINCSGKHDPFQTEQTTICWWYKYDKLYVFIQFTNRTAVHFNDSASPQYQCGIE